MGAAAGGIAFRSPRVPAAEGETTGGRVREPATIRAAFLYPPSTTFSSNPDGWWSWPGNDFDAEGIGFEELLADDGELLVRGPCVMHGYWNKPAETAEAIDDDPVRCLDPDASAAMVAAIDAAKADRDTLGGVFELVAVGLPPGLQQRVPGGIETVLDLSQINDLATGLLQGGDQRVAVGIVYLAWSKRPARLNQLIPGKEGGHLELAPDIDVCLTN